MEENPPNNDTPSTPGDQGQTEMGTREATPPGSGTPSTLGSGDQRETSTTRGTTSDRGTETTPAGVERSNGDPEIGTPKKGSPKLYERIRPLGGATGLIATIFLSAVAVWELFDGRDIAQEAPKCKLMFLASYYLSG